MLAEKVQHDLADLVCVSLKGEVAGVKDMHSAFGKSQEEEIVLAPCRHEGWLLLAKILLTRGIERWIGPGNRG